MHTATTEDPTSAHRSFAMRLADIATLSFGGFGCAAQREDG